MAALGARLEHDLEPALQVEALAQVTVERRARHAEQRDARERRDEQHDERQVGAARSQVVRDVGVREVQAARRRLVAIALLGDGERDDADRRIAHRGDQRAVALLDRDEIDHRADESRLEVAGRKLDHARHPVLRRQRLAHLRVARPHPGADDGPVLRQAEPEEVVEIDRHMGAVEIAAADMDDAGLQSRAVIARRGHAIGQVFQRCIGRFHVMPS